MTSRHDTTQTSKRPRRAPLDDDGALVSVATAADYLGISQWKVRKLIADGSIPSCHVGRVLRVRESDVRAYVTRQLAV